MAFTSTTTGRTQIDLEHTAKLAKAIEDSGHLSGVSDASWDWSDSWTAATTAAPLLLVTLATFELTNGAATNNQRESAVYWLLKCSRSDWEGLL